MSLPLAELAQLMHDPSPDHAMQHCTAQLQDTYCVTVAAAAQLVIQRPQSQWRPCLAGHAVQKLRLQLPWSLCLPLQVTVAAALLQRTLSCDRPRQPAWLGDLSTQHCVGPKSAGQMYVPELQGMVITPVS